MATTSTRTPAPTDAPIPPELPIFSTAEALALLWNKAKLNRSELEWFAFGAANQVREDAHHLSEVLSALGCLISNDEGSQGSLTSPGGAAGMLFNISSQLSTIEGIASIADEAANLIHMPGAAA